MSRIITTTAIVLLWVHAMAWLVATEVVPAVREAREAREGLRYEDLQPTFLGHHTTTMGVYRDPRDGSPMEQVGRMTHTVVSTEDGLTVRMRLNLDVATAVPGAETLGTQTEFQARSVGGRLVSFQMWTRVQHVPRPVAEVFGQAAGDRISLRAVVMGQEFTHIIQHDPDFVLDPGASPLLGMPDLRVGMRWRIRTVDLFGGRIAEEWARVVGRETIQWDGRDVECYRVEIARGRDASVAWVDDNGRLLKQRTAMFTFVLEEEDFSAEGEQEGGATRPSPTTIPHDP